MPPTVAVIMLHPQCNMHCSFCITEDSMGTFNFGQACALLDRLEREGFRSVVLGGGEPLEWTGGVFELAREAKARGFTVQLGTNGILLAAGFEHADSIDRYVLPLDGSTAEVHDALRFHRGSHFEIVIERLARLSDAGKSTTISTVLTRVNEADLGNVAKLLIGLHAERPFLHAWHLYQFIPAGRGGARHRAELLLPAAGYDRACESVKQLHPPFHVFKRPDMLHSRMVEFFWLRDGHLHRQLGMRHSAESI